jgi:dCTP deaminase
MSAQQRGNKRGSKRTLSADDSGTGRIAPGAHLRAELKRLGLDQVAVSKATGVSRQSINNIINGRQAISRAMAGKLGRLTGRSSDYWLREAFAAPTSRTTVAKAASAQAAALSLLVNHQIARAVKDGIIGIEPFVLRNLHAVSIDLTLDGRIVIVGGDRMTVARGKEFILEPGQAISASTIESIDLPRDYVARAAAAACLSARGLIASSGLRIEPGFKGRLKFSLFNAGAEPFGLRAHDPVLGLEIFRLGATPDTATIKLSRL